MDYKDLALLLYKMSWAWLPVVGVIVIGAYQEHSEKNKINLENLLK